MPIHSGPSGSGALVRLVRAAARVAELPVDPGQLEPQLGGLVVAGDAVQRAHVPQLARARARERGPGEEREHFVDGPQAIPFGARLPRIQELVANDRVARRLDRVGVRASLNFTLTLASTSICISWPGSLSGSF